MKHLKHLSHALSTGANREYEDSGTSHSQIPSLSRTTVHGQCLQRLSSNPRSPAFLKPVNRFIPALKRVIEKKGRGEPSALYHDAEDGAPLTETKRISTLLLRAEAIRLSIAREWPS